VSGFEGSPRVREVGRLATHRGQFQKAIATALFSKVRSAYDKVRNIGGEALQKQARITSKGQVTVPREIRRVLGVRSGDRLLFESDEKGVRVRPVRTESPFAKFKGIGNPGIVSGRKGIIRWVRELRGR
jgi:AbrB family looped-hinge helix DNA binding protein